MEQQNMQVVKRDGRREDVHFEKVQQRIVKAAEGLTVNATKVAQGVLARIVDGITTTELDTITANLAYAWSTTHPDYGDLAARIAVSNHQKNTYASLLETVECLAGVKDRRGEPASVLDPSFVEAVRRNAAAIEARIDYSRDYLFDYFGFKTLERAYLLRDTARRVVERPQHLWMRVALGLWLDTARPEGVDLAKAFETYDMMSTKLYTHATPTLFNAGTKRPQLSSCFLLAIGDSIRDIYKTLEDCALISQYGGGIGLHVSNIRAKGSLIRGTGGVSNGIVPMLRVFNNTARYVDQCFTPETLVHAREGPVAIKDLVAGAEVLTSGCGETVEDDGKHLSVPPASVLTYNRITKHVVHTYSGKILKIRTAAGVTGVTPQHPILAVTGARTALSIRRALEEGVLTLDYTNAGVLQEDDWVARPAAPGEHASFHGLTFHQIQAIDEEDYDGELYDLEVENTHDYAVAALGIVHNGGGKRNGSFAMYLEPWHADVEDFLEMKKNTGSEEERARDLFYAMWIPDLFMQRVQANGDWTLFCPNEAPGLADVVGDEFKALYERYESEGLGRKTVKAQKLWFQILDSQIETGTPYLCYKDAANKKSNQQNLGVIKSSNLCVAPETLILTDAGEVPIATLAGKTVRVWNGTHWSETTVVQTGQDQELMTVCITDVVEGARGITHTYVRELTCTPYHKFLLPVNDDHKGRAIHTGTVDRIEASALEEGMELYNWQDDEGNLHTPIVTAIRREGRRDATYCFTEPEHHAGVFNGILTGNCSEIIEYSNAEETAVCNLASMNLPAFVKDGAFDFAAFRDAVKIVVRNLDRVIDINYYPIPEAERSNMRHRPIGLGVQGLADVFALCGLPWESEGAAALNRRIFAHMYYAAVAASVDLAAAHGRYETFVGSPAWKGQLQYDLWGIEPVADAGLDWDALTNDVRRIGLRNSLLVAVMPTASTSQILGNCECIEPYATHIFTRRTLAGEFIIVNKHLVRALLARGLWTPELKDAIIANNGSVAGLASVPEDIQQIFKTVWEIKQKTLIDMSADRAPYVCQSQSLNLFLADPDYRKLSSMHMYAWSRGLKTGIYYMRTRAVASAQKFTVEPVKAIGGAGAPAEAAPAVKEEEGCVMCSS